jgi:hypothetical protein
LKQSRGRSGVTFVAVDVVPGAGKALAGLEGFTGLESGMEVWLSQRIWQHCGPLNTEPHHLKSASRSAFPAIALAWAVDIEDVVSLGTARSTEHLLPTLSSTSHKL